MQLLFNNNSIIAIYKNQFIELDFNFNLSKIQKEKLKLMGCTIKKFKIEVMKCLD